VIEFSYNDGISGAIDDGREGTVGRRLRDGVIRVAYL